MHGRKRYSRKGFGKELLEINLYENKQAARALASANDVQEFISRLTLFLSSTLIPGDTLIFIDEVQEAPDAMTMVKFLVADGRFDYVFSGSMLGTEFKGVRSYPRWLGHRKNHATHGFRGILLGHRRTEDDA